MNKGIIICHHHHHYHGRCHCHQHHCNRHYSVSSPLYGQPLISCNGTYSSLLFHLNYTFLFQAILFFACSLKPVFLILLSCAFLLLQSVASTLPVFLLMTDLQQKSWLEPLTSLFVNKYDTVSFCCFHLKDIFIVKNLPKEAFSYEVLAHLFGQRY